MKFASLGSGSEGNSLLISAAADHSRTTVMLDCGFGVRETQRRLERLGLTPADIDGIIVTHEHSDHVGGVFPFARRHKIPVWMTWGTLLAVAKTRDGVEVGLCRDSLAFRIGGLEITPYTVPHDAREPVQYVVSDGSQRLGVLTDAGQSTSHLVDMLGGCDALILECNHDRAMLANSTYPAFLRRRIGGAFGHLSNDTSAAILAALDRSRLRTVIGAHLSQQNNTPELALAALRAVEGSDEIDIRIACQEQGFDWIDLMQGR